MCILDDIDSLGKSNRENLRYSFQGSSANKGLPAHYVPYSHPSQPSVEPKKIEANILMDERLISTDPIEKI